MDSSQGAWDALEFSAVRGLVRRLYFAKCKGSCPDWWRGKLSSDVSGSNTVLLAILVCWGSGKVIQELSSHIGGALDSLGEKEWSEFWTLATLTMSVAGPQITRLRSDWFMENDGLTERLAASLTQRLSDEADRRLVARKCFRSYSGGDRRILQIAAEWELLSEPYDNIDWNFAKRLSLQARANSIEYLFSPSHARHRVNVPLEVAEQALIECDKHNWQFLSLCKSSLGSFVARRERKVATVANEEKWFDEEAGT